MSSGAIDDDFDDIMVTGVEAQPPLFKVRIALKLAVL